MAAPAGYFLRLLTFRKISPPMMNTTSPMAMIVFNSISYNIMPFAIMITFIVCIISKNHYNRNVVSNIVINFCYNI